MEVKSENNAESAFLFGSTVCWTSGAGLCFVRCLHQTGAQHFLRKENIASVLLGAAV